MQKQRGGGGSPYRNRLARVRASICSTTSRTRRRSRCAQLQKISLAQKRDVSQGVAEKPHRLPHRGCRDAGVVDDGLEHNRVRMIVASFLVKDLLLSWTEGARWFWDTLVDADLAQNTLGWQWTAGCGADATPYFRVFDPVRQGEKFDPMVTTAPLVSRTRQAPWRLAAPAVAGTPEVERVGLGRTSQARCQPCHRPRSRARSICQNQVHRSLTAKTIGIPLPMSGFKSGVNSRNRAATVRERSNCV